MTFEEWYGVGWDSISATDARDAWEAARLDMQEQCADLCNQMALYTGVDCATAIMESLT